MFSTSKCGNCGGTNFKVVTQEPAGSNYKVIFVQCSSCSTPVGVLDFFNTGSQLETQKQMIQDLSKKVVHIEGVLGQVLSVLQHRR